VYLVRVGARVRARVRARIRMRVRVRVRLRRRLRVGAVARVLVFARRTEHACASERTAHLVRGRGGVRVGVRGGVRVRGRGTAHLGVAFVVVGRQELL